MRRAWSRVLSGCVHKLPLHRRCSTMAVAVQYPPTRRSDHQDTLHGTVVPDPYRWLEDPDSEETKGWVASQNEVTNKFLGSIPFREKIKDQLTERFNYEKVGAPGRHGDHYYYYRNSGLQNHYVLYATEGLKGEGEVFLDPNTFSEDGTVAMGSVAFTETGKLCAYTTSAGGSDWQTIHVLDCTTKELLPDQVEWTKYCSIMWTHDELGFFYTCYKPPETLGGGGDMTKKAGTETDTAKDQMVRYHRLGTPIEADQEIYRDPTNPEHMFGCQVTEDGKYLILTTHEGCRPANLVHYVEVEQLSSGKPLNFIKLISEFESQYDYVTNVGTVFYFLTNNQAPRKRLITIDLARPEPENWRVIIPETESVLAMVSVANTDKLVVCVCKDAKDMLYLYDMEGNQTKEFPLPLGSISGLSCDRKYDELFFKFVSFLYPGRIYRYHFPTGELTVHRDIVVKDFDADKFEMEQVFYSSKDGTRVPMFLVHKKGLAKEGNNGCLLYGYGGFNIGLTPDFSIFRLTFLQHFDGVYAMANLRGGDEYGETWHEAGIKERKQNVFDDFQAAAQWLVDNKYTSPKKLSIMGGSNGGLLVAACANQAPQLMSAVICQVGVLDMLRFHKFTIGHAWCTDFGSPDDPEGFQYIHKYSPLHNVDPAKEYPAMMLLTGDHDDRVVPLHSFKHIATLQHHHPQNPNPLLIRIEVDVGHGAGKPIKKVIEEVADYYSFLASVTKLEWVD